ncbi:hypothetical protein EJD97_024925 [Solanum chilense]|uniref:Uncharacterized protein n=1 Tax=Solanum chilense TaxID=4083 RepID=A0A6N2C0R5_SOLCI|nr:hypothetical protein EJD97_024925 [Solanum chilense]
MNTSSTPTKRVEENDVNEKISPKVEKYEQVPEGVDDMGVTSVEKVKLASYQLRDVFQAWFRKGDQVQEEPRSSKVKLDKGGGSQNGKPTCVNCGIRQYGMCLADISGCYVCGNDDHKALE